MKRAWRGYLAGGVALAVAHGSGVSGDAVMIILSVATPVAITLGVRSARPRPVWPWWLMIAAGIVWSVAGAVRTAVHSTADLSASRSLTPDFFAVPGYLMFAIALVGLGFAQQKGRIANGLGVDIAILAGAACLIAWVGLINPVLHADASTAATIAIALYPPLSVMVVAAAGFVAFGAGEPSPSHRLLLGGTVAILVGDLMFVPVELGTLITPGPWFEVPYAVAYGLFGAAALHPSFAQVATARPRTATQRFRFVLIGASLITPAVMIAVWSPTGQLEQLLVGSATVALSLAGSSRLVVAMQAQDEATRHVEHRATHNMLTGLPNRALLTERLDEWIETAQRDQTSVTIAFLDLDRFKLVNDTFGHAAGDELIQQAAERLTSTIRDVDLVAHLSGDEFVVVSTGLSRSAAQRLGERIRVAFAEPFDLHGTRYVTASVGMTVAFPAEMPTDSLTLLREADTAMYEAKGRGRDRVAVFGDDMRTRAEQRLALESALRGALERDELHLNYQLVVETCSGRPAGVEALLRWTHDDTAISPAEFIPVAEDTGLIEPIGAWVLETACAQIAEWRRLDGCEDLTVAVNVSPRQLATSDLPEVVADALARADLPPEALWLEITEVAMIDDTIDTLASLSALRSMGIRLSVDDFGTGYSSLSYLQRYPFDQVKVDRSFVRHLDTDQTSRQLVQAIIEVAVALDMMVVAEGIEHPEQAALLAEMGCHHAQGFYFAIPAPPADVEPLLVPVRALP